MHVDSVVVGAGVVGLAVARALALRGHEVWVLEADSRAGEGVSSRNSGVIHAGMYYPSGSLKARCCVRGNRQLYAYCVERGIAHRRTQKLIVASTESQLPALRDLADRAEQNGVEVAWLEASQTLAMAPGLRCVAALHSPSTGIVDVAELVVALQGEIESLGGRVLTRTAVQCAEPSADGWRVRTADESTLTCRVLINAAGLGAPELANRIEGFAQERVPKMHYAQGHYYSLRGKSPFAQLIYPLPPAASLGVHLCLDLAGRCRFGPDLRWISAPSYRFDDSQRDAFIAAIRQWWPDLPAQNLQPDFVGVRPKISGPGEPNADFSLLGPSHHGLDGLVQLFGIESPGLTSSLALADEVVQMID